MKMLKKMLNQMIAKKRSACNKARCIAFALSLLVIQDAAAKCGSVNYSLGADGLALMHDYVVTMMLYVLYIIYAVSAIFVIYASLQIYIKMNIGEEGVVKDIMMVIGACIFMIGASIVFPAFFGYQI